MANSLVKRLGMGLVVSMVIVSPASAGGLAAAIVEDSPVIAAPAPVTQRATSGWVMPLVALLIVGAVAAGSSDSDDDGGDDEGTDLPTVGDVK